MFRYTGCLCINLFQRGTNELKKYLRSRIEEPSSTQPQKAVSEGKAASGLIGDQGGLDAHTIHQFKSLDYRYCLFKE